MRADKELLKGGALGGRMQAEALTNIRAIFIVIGDFQPVAFIIRAVLQIHSATAQHQRIFKLQRGFQHVVGVDQDGIALAAAAGGDIVFRVTLRAVFKAKTKITLLAMAFVILKPALAAAAKVFNQRAVGGGFPPKRIGETACRAKNLDRHVVAFPLRGSYFRRVKVVRITGVIENQAVRFTRRQAQAAADDLLVKAHRLGRAQDGDQIDMRRIKAGRQNRDVNQIAVLLSFKRVDDAIALRPRRFTGD